MAGTREGVKCLHAHYAYLLAGGDDPVGRWVASRLDELAGGSGMVSEGAKRDEAMDDGATGEGMVP